MIQLFNYFRSLIMSSIEYRPIVKSVALTYTTGVQAVKVTGELFNLFGKGLSVAAKLTYNAVKSSIKLSQTAIQSANELRSTVQNIQQESIATARKKGLSEAEAHKVAGLAMASVYVVNDSQVLHQAIQTLHSNPSASTLQAMQTSLEVAHQELFTERLSLAVSNAALKVGFTPIQSSIKVQNGVIRLVADDQTGRLLVTEIRSDRDHPTSLATEIIGSSDNTCNEILDAFNVALEAEGVKVGDRDRKFTGGILELDAAREFVNQRVKSKSTNRAESNAVKQTKPRPVVKKLQQTQRF